MINRVARFKSSMGKEGQGKGRQELINRSATNLPSMEKQEEEAKAKVAIRSLQAKVVTRW